MNHDHSLDNVQIIKTVNRASLDESLCRNFNTRAVARLIGQVDGSSLDHSGVVRFGFLISLLIKSAATFEEASLIRFG